MNLYTDPNAGTEEIDLKEVIYTGTDQLYKGYAVCFDRAATTDPTIASKGKVIKPASGNLFNFAGVVMDRPVEAGTGSQKIRIGRTNGAPRLVELYTNQNCTDGTTILTVVAGSYIFGGIGQGVPVAIARQTVDRSSTNGLVLAEVYGVSVSEMVRAARTMGTPSSSVNTLSSAIWESAPGPILADNPSLGLSYFNDFHESVQAANVAATATTLRDGVVAFTGATAGSTVSSETDEPYGVAALNCTTDNETVCISALGSRNTAGQVILNASSRLWMEARVKLPSIADDLNGVFLGFGEEALCVTVGVIGADDELTDKDLVGFHHLAADGDKWDTRHNTQGGGGITTVTADAVTAVADTYVNLGMKWNGATLTFYANGVALSGTVALAATNFPDGEEMAWYYALTNKGGGDAVANIDWVKIEYIKSV